MNVYPLIKGGTVLAQYPYTERDEWINAESSVPAGNSYTRSENATVLRRIRIMYSAIQSADVVVLQNFFNSMRARLGEFSFTDDQGTTWVKCRFDMDTFEVHYIAPAHSSVEVRLSMEPN